MKASRHRAEMVQKVSAGLGEQVAKIVAEHIQARQITSASFDVLLERVRQTFPGLPPEALDAACSHLNSAARSEWTKAFLERVLDCGDVYQAMTQTPPTTAAEFPRRPGDGSFLL